MFWRGRKRKEGAWRVAVDDTTTTTTQEAQQARQVDDMAVPVIKQASDDDTPDPTTSGDDTEEVAMMEEEEANEEEEDETSSQEWSAAPEAAPPATVAPPPPLERELTPAERLERKRQDAMQNQKVLETQALARNSFCKNQRVQYTHKASGRKYEAVVVDVHFDDGIDRPYFTIRYEMGEESSEIMEKQTTSDRLAYVGFDEAKTYKILASKIKF